MAPASASAATTPTPTPQVEPTTDYAVFEGMFARVLKPTGGFAAELRSVGFDPEHPRGKYPTRVWNASLDVAHRHVFPDLPREVAMRNLGRQFIEGFYATIVGHMIRVTLPILGPLRVMQRLPKNYEMVRTGVRMTVTQEGPREVRVDCRDAHAEPDFTAGLIEGAAHYTHAKAKAEVVSRAPGAYVLRVRWDDL